MNEGMSVEDSYELSLFQQEVLFHMLYAPKTGVYVEQVTLTLKGRIDVEVFCAAWDLLIGRHPILRTTFHWKNPAKPIQIVRKDGLTKLDQQDWRGMSVTEQSNKLRAYLAVDRRRGFDLTEGPTFRMALLRLTDDQYRFLWSFPGILLDGRSYRIALAQLFTCYRELVYGRKPVIDPGPVYSDYLACVRSRSTQNNEKYWRTTLQNFRRPNRLEAGSRPLFDGSDRFSHDFVEADLSFLIPPLVALTCESQLTIDTLAQGAWMLLVSRYSGDDDVIIGTMLGSEQSEFSDVETNVGPNDRDRAGAYARLRSRAPGERVAGRASTPTHPSEGA